MLLGGRLFFTLFVLHLNLYHTVWNAMYGSFLAAGETRICEIVNLKLIPVEARAGHSRNRREYIKRMNLFKYIILCFRLNLGMIENHIISSCYSETGTRRSMMGFMPALNVLGAQFTLLS